MIKPAFITESPSGPRGNTEAEGQQEDDGERGERGVRLTSEEHQRRGGQGEEDDLIKMIISLNVILIA